MIRFVLVVLYLGLFLLLGIPVQFLLIVIGIFAPAFRDRASVAIVSWGCSCATALSGADPEFIGLENIPEDRAVLFVGNHRSYFDILITLSITKKRMTGYVAKKEMVNAPLLNLWMQFIHCKFMDRKDTRQALQIILSCIDEVKNGVNIFIFPEGTRSKGPEGTMLDFHEGSLKIATKADCPVVPVAISNSWSVWEKQFPRMKKAHVIVEYCKPFIPSQLAPEDKKAMAAYTRNIIAEALKSHEGMF